MKIYFLGSKHLPEYHNHAEGIHAKAGDRIEINDAIATGLMIDFPGIFVDKLPKTGSVDDAPKDKQIKGAEKKK